jgi:hypothetical protein
VTILALNKVKPDANIEKLRASHMEINALIEKCGERDPTSRPSSLKLLQVSRKALGMLPQNGDSKQARPGNLYLDFPFLVMTKYLSMLFYSFSKSYSNARPDWIARLILYWEDFGHSVAWTEVEKGFLDIILLMAFEEIRKKDDERQAKENEKRESRGRDPRPHVPFRKLVPIEVDSSLENRCRWNSYRLSPVDLKRLARLAISGVEPGGV